MQYTYKFCSPSRSSLLSGRLPIHVNVYNDDPARPGAGVPVGMTMISEKLVSASYIAHFIGKVCTSARAHSIRRSAGARMHFSRSQAVNVTCNAKGRVISTLVWCVYMCVCACVCICVCVRAYVTTIECAMDPVACGNGYHITNPTGARLFELTRLLSFI